MYRRCFSISAARLKAPAAPPQSGEFNRFRAAFTNTRQPNPPSDRPAAPSNRFKSFHENKKGPRGSHGHKNEYKKEYKNDFRERDNSRGKKPAMRRAEPPRPVFNITTGSERAQTALKSLITKVKSESSNFQVNYVDPETKKFLTVGLHGLVNDLDLSKQGIKVLPAQGDSLPIIRIVPGSEMLEAYADELADLKQKELLAMGNARALKSANMRAQAERKKSATKILTLSWSISVSDLQNQKKNEIENRLKKDDKLMIFLGEKSSLSSARRNAEREESLNMQLKTSNTKWDRMDEDENLLEMKKRELVFAKLQEVLESLDCKTDVSGTLDARMMIKLTSNGAKATDAGGEPEVSAKEAKRLKKLERAKERAREKEAKMSEQDIDSLYSLKIED